MPAITRLLYGSLVTVLCACSGPNHPGTGGTYAIRDFGDSLRPYLVTIVSRGIVGYDSATWFVRNHTSNEVLRQLSASEHPVLRALALEEMLTRKGFDAFSVLMSHLSDTADVIEDIGEFGEQHIFIADLLIFNNTWKSEADRKATFDKVITAHNYLRAAYTISDRLPTEEKYYPYIRAMAARDRNYAELEHALLALAHFKKPADTSLIKEKLLQSTWRMSLPSFTLIREYPNNAYFEVLEKYYRYSLYRNMCRNGELPNDAAWYFHALAAYRQPRSAALLERIWNHHPIARCPVDTSFLRRELAEAVWENRCPAYSKLEKQVKPLIIEQDKNSFYFPVDTTNMPKIIRWFNF